MNFQQIVKNDKFQKLIMLLTTSHSKSLPTHGLFPATKTSEKGIKTKEPRKNK